MITLSLAAAIAQSASAAPHGAEAREVLSVARAVMREQHLAGMILRVDRANRHVVTAALGESMTGVPVTRDMRFRIGSESIPYLTTILLQLQQEGRLDLDDPLSKYLPSSGVPNAGRVTLRMLGHSISGYPDWIQGNPAFVELLSANPFGSGPTRTARACVRAAADLRARRVLPLRPHELPAAGPGGQRRQRAALRHGRAPADLRAVGAARHDDHAHREAARAGAARVRNRSRAVEDTSSWSPSWGLGKGQLMVSTIDDVAASARSILAARLISRASERQFVARPAVIKTPIPGLSYGLGVLLAGDWRVQNPYVNNYGGVMAYLPDARLSISAVSTKGPNADFNGSNPSETLLTRLAAAIAPRHPVRLPTPA